MKPLNPASVAPPFARYSHGVCLGLGDLVLTSGQLGITPDGEIPEGAYAQARLCFANIAAILAEADLGAKDVLRLNAYVTGREHMDGYMRARDEYLGDLAVLPASTLVIVSGFTRPQFVVEIEATAARSPQEV